MSSVFTVEAETADIAVAALLSAAIGDIKLKQLLPIAIYEPEESSRFAAMSPTEAKADELISFCDANKPAIISALLTIEKQN